MDQSARRRYLIQHLLAEHPDGKEIKIPVDPQQQRYLLRGLFNIRPAHPISAEFQQVQDQYLQGQTQQKGVVKENEFRDGLNSGRVILPGCKSM